MSEVSFTTRGFRFYKYALVVNTLIFYQQGQFPKAQGAAGIKG